MENKLFLLVFIIIMVLRIPRFPGIVGNDGFVVLWMGHIASEGYYINWLLSPLSPFGFFPFAKYPLGTAVLMGFLIRIGLEFAQIALLISIAWTCIGIVGAYHLGTSLFSRKEESVLFTAVYVFSRMFTFTTTFTVSARAPILALLPWLLSTSIEYTRKRERRLLFKIFLLFVLMLLFHTLAFFVLIYFLVYTAYALLLEYGVLDKILNYMHSIASKYALQTQVRTSTSTSFHRIQFDEESAFQGAYLLLLLGSCAAAYLLGLILLPVSPYRTTELFLTNDTFLGATVNLIIDYGFRLGIFSIFFPIGILVGVKQQASRRRALQLILIPTVFLFMPVSVYSSVLFLPVTAYYSVEGFSYLESRISSCYLGLVLGIFASILSVSYITVILEGYDWAVIFSMAVLIGLVLQHVYKIVSTPLEKPSVNAGREAIVGVILVIVSFSLVSYNGLMLQKDYGYLTSDEQAVASHLSEENVNIVFVFTPVVGRRLQAFGYAALRSDNEDAIFYFGWASPEAMLSRITINLSRVPYKGIPFDYSGVSPEIDLFRKLTDLDLQNLSQLQEARTLRLTHVVVEKTPIGYNPNYRNQYLSWFSNILYSAPAACELVFEGEQMSLFRLP